MRHLLCHSFCLLFFGFHNSLDRRSTSKRILETSLFTPTTLSTIEYLTTYTNVSVVVMGINIPIIVSLLNIRRNRRIKSNSLPKTTINTMTTNNTKGRIRTTRSQLRLLRNFRLNLIRKLRILRMTRIVLRLLRTTRTKRRRRRTKRTYHGTSNMTN